MSQRHISRQIALQTMYELDVRAVLDIDRVDLRDVINRNIEELSPDHKDKTYLYDLLDMVLTRLSTINDIIVKAAPEWPMEKISYIDRNILRIGLAELLFADREQVPPKVAIDQAIELAKAFGSETSSKFINGVLGAIYKELGEPDKNSIARKRNLEEELTGVVLYSIDKGEMYIGLVHDLFKHWTICKSHTDTEKTDIENIKRVAKKEFGIDEVLDYHVVKKGQYIANHPEKGKIVKNVTYYLVKVPHLEPIAELGGGLDDAKWWKLSEMGSIKIYKEINDLLATCVASLKL